MIDQRKTFSCDDKLTNKILNLESQLQKETHKHWSDSKVIRGLIAYAFDHGANAKTLAKIFDD